MRNLALYIIIALGFGLPAQANIVLADPFACEKGTHLTIAFDVIKEKVSQLQCLEGERAVNLKLVSGKDVLEEDMHPYVWCKLVNGFVKQYAYCEGQKAF